MSIATLLLIIGLVKGSIALSSLTVADIAGLAAAGVNVARIGILLEQRLGKLPRPRLQVRNGRSYGPETFLCFQGAPSGQAARMCAMVRP